MLGTPKHDLMVGGTKNSDDSIGPIVSQVLPVPPGSQPEEKHLINPKPVDLSTELSIGTGKI